MARRQSAVRRVTERRRKWREGVSLSEDCLLAFPIREEGRRGAEEGEEEGKGEEGRPGPSSYNAQFH